MTKHTPLPWALHPMFPTHVIPASDVGKKIGGADDPDREAAGYAKEIVSQWGTEYLEFSRSRVIPAEAKANAEFIVRACNSHGDLVAVLKTICAADDVKSLAGIVDALDAARAAIAKAEGPSD